MILKKNLCEIRKIKATFRLILILFISDIDLFRYVYYCTIYYLLRCNAEKYQASSMLCNNAPCTVNTEISGNLCLRDEKIEVPWTESVVMNNAICSLKSSSQSREKSEEREKR